MKAGPMATALKESDTTRQDQVEHWIREAMAARLQYEAEGRSYAALCQRESELVVQRLFVKEESKRRMMETEPSLSATRADDKVRTEPRYVSHLEIQRDVVREKDDACTRMHSARLRAETAIAAIKAIAGLI
jgi:hypothetical protein